MNLWGHRFSQNTNQKLQGFLPYQTNKDRSTFLVIFFGYNPCLFGWAEILVILGLHFGRNDDLINSFIIYLTFNTFDHFMSNSLKKSWTLSIEGPFICPECQDNFSSSEALKNHWKIKHKTIKHKPYDKLEEECLCNLCGKTFKRKSYLKEHLKEVHERLPYICSG